jgi:hypothetical protein
MQPLRGARVVRERHSNYQIAAVTALSTAAGGTITITQNAYTNAVTPGCCSPPGIGGATCTGPWGVTNSG